MRQVATAIGGVWEKLIWDGPPVGVNCQLRWCRGVRARDRDQKLSAIAGQLPSDCLVSMRSGSLLSLQLEEMMTSALDVGVIMKRFNLRFLLVVGSVYIANVAVTMHASSS